MVSEKNFLVTGGCGFIGSNFVRYMLENYQHCSVINLDKLTYAVNPDNLRDFEKDTRYSFIHISTDEVYGSIKKGSFKEADILNPSSPYSASKAGSDLLVSSYSITHGLHAIITRCTNNFGPYQYPEKLIPLFVTNLLEDRKVSVYGTGQNMRDWIYVHDHCHAIDFIIHKGKNGEIYNIGSGNERTNIEITEKILELLDRDRSMIQFVEDRKGHDFRYSLDFSKIRKLGWKPAYDFETALSETVHWYRQNRWWWERLKP
ncbi:MAG: GDP-mannose 4,6-dehydratase [Candidatus Methanoperedens sp.]|nr:GDP-mannose 4,6-dehydratase [Candidatus Methanoperedens sp.]MCE8427580.1 GDP-mannose 4,6-dehydratase [Candidatus Methanoperedens sp.]